MRAPVHSVSRPRRCFLKTIAALPLVGATPFQISVRAAEARNPFATENPVINKARDVALSILKPSAQQREHGLRLHEEALVFESYGFAPRFAIDGAAFAAALQAGASDEELVDLREDMTMTRGATHARERAEFLEAFRAAGVTCIFQNAGEESNDPLRLIRRLARFTYTTDLMRDDLFKAAKPDDIVAAKRQNRRCLYFTANGVPLRQTWQNVRDELGFIRTFQRLGIRMMHLTYNRRNLIGDGAGEPGNAGLSDFGRAVVVEMNRLGMIVDVAHSGWQTSLEAAKASTRPMVASHTTCAGIYRHFRGKPDEVIKAICDTGGLIGICAIPRFLGGTGDITAFLDHVDYAVQRFGDEHVAIGLDIAYTSRFDAEERAKVPKRTDGRPALSVSGPRFEHLWPADDYRPKPHAVQSLAWTNWPLLTVGMVQRGHSDATIRKILGENVLRVTRANFAG